MIIALSFLGLLNDDYLKGIKEFNQFDVNNWLHYDIMDGKFVFNTTFDETLVKEVVKKHDLFNDLHLMIANPDTEIERYLIKGVNQITFHYEAVTEDQIIPLINKIKERGIKVGISIKPSTNVEVLDNYLKYLDYILIMSVEPGKGGQMFLDSSLPKIRYLNKKKRQYSYLIGVDGGINDLTISLVKDAGVDVCVVGSYLTNNFNREQFNKLKDLI